MPYGGSGPAIIDIIAGNVDMIVADIPAIVAHVEAGKLNALAVFGDERSAALPDVPTSAEHGHPDLKTGNYYFIVGPKGMDAAVAKRLGNAIQAAAKSDGVLTS